MTLNGLFLVTALVAWGFDTALPVKDKPGIQGYLASVDGYEAVRNIQLLPNAYEMLKLDDYFYMDFSGPDGRVNLYVGYYYTPNKAYAAHSPLVCYPAQGWRVTRQPVSGSMTVGDHRIHYEAIVAESGREKELVVYWYQSRLHTNTKGYRNKISMAVNRLLHKDDQHAFVRVSAPFGDATGDQVLNRITGFIEAFYPSFLNFIHAEGDAQG